VLPARVDRIQVRRGRKPREKTKIDQTLRCKRAIMPSPTKMPPAAAGDRPGPRPTCMGPVLATKMSPTAPGARPLRADRDTLRAEWRTVFHSREDDAASSLRLKSPLRKPVSAHARAASGASTQSYHRLNVVGTESVAVDTVALTQDWLKSAIFSPRAEPLAWCGRFPSPLPTNCVAARSWSLVGKFSSSLEEIHKKRPQSARRVRLEDPLAARPSSACFSDRKHLRSTSHSHVIVARAPDVSNDLSPTTNSGHSGHLPSRRLRHHNRHQDTLLRDLHEIKERVCEQQQELGQKQREIEALKREVASAKALSAAAGGQDGSEEWKGGRGGLGESAAGATKPEATGPLKPDVTRPSTPRAPLRKSLTLTRSASLKSVSHAPPTPSTLRRKVALYKATKPGVSIIFEPCGTDLMVQEAFPVLFPLLDEGDKCLLVHALWKAAGEPRDGAREWGAAAEEGPGEAWSVENLEGLEFQTLVDLQAVAGPGYRRSAPMALQLISLEQGNTFGDDLKFRPNKHLHPLEEYIKCEVCQC